MIKRYFKVLLCGGLLLSATGFVSCNDDDIDDLKSRMSVVEGMISQLKTAMESGATVTEATQDANGVWTLKLSNGVNIVLSGGGGGNVSVIENENNIIIKVDGKEYVLPKGAAPATLVYAPQYEDGMEVIKEGAIEVWFRVPESVTADKVAAATFDIDEAHALKTRAGSEFFKVMDGAKLEDGFVKMNIKAMSVEPGKTYAVSVQMVSGGQTYISNYFRVKIDDNFVDVSEALEDYTITAALPGAEKEDILNDNEEVVSHMWVANLPKDLVDEFSFADFVDGVPANVHWEIAPKGAQTNGQGCMDVLKNSLGKDGKWKLAGRLGTAFPDGLFINLVDDNDVIKMKFKFIFNDPWADLNFKELSGLNGNFEVELYGRDGRFVAPGASTLDIPSILANYETELPIRHSGDDWFIAYSKYDVKDPVSGESLVYNNGEGQLVAGDGAKKYLAHSRGVFWYYRGFMLVVPETLATDGKYSDETGEFGGGEGYGYDAWGSGNPYDYATMGADAFYKAWGASDTKKIADFGLKLDEKTGEFSFPADYTGWGVRIAFAGGFEYVYGVKDLTGNGSDQFGMIFINRRASAEDAKMPTKN